MDSLLVPSDVEDALAAAGFRAVEIVGTGWLAEPLDGSDRRLELHVVPAVVDDRLSERAARLRGLRHEHLPQVVEVLDLAPGRVALVVEHVPGLSLAQIRAARAPLTDGEAATVTIPLAGAIDALRGAGLAHGAVSASSVVLRPDGRPVLIDLGGALTGADDPVADLRSLLSTVLAQMPGADVHLVTGVPGEVTLRDAFTELLTAPGVSCDDAVEECYRVTQPEPVRLPDAGLLASSALSAVARQAEPGRQVAGTRREERARRRRRAVRLAAAVAAVAVLAVGALLWRQPEAPPPASGRVLEQVDDPVAAAAELSRRRAEVIATGDPAALGSVEVVDGPAHRADVLLLPGLEGARVEGLTVDVADAWLVAAEGRSDTTDVAVTSAMSAHSRVPVEGGPVTEVAASPERTVVLGLRWTAQGWRVWDVRAP